MRRKSSTDNLNKTATGALDGTKALEKKEKNFNLSKSSHRHQLTLIEKLNRLDVERHDQFVQSVTEAMTVKRDLDAERTSSSRSPRSPSNSPRKVRSVGSRQAKSPETANRK